MKKLSIRIILYPVVFFAALLIMLPFIEEKLIYFPEKRLEGTPEQISLSYENVKLETSDGLRLHSWWIEKPLAKKTVLFFHGNAGNISHRLDRIRMWKDLRVNFLLVEYRGYGLNDGSPNERGLYKDADSAYFFLTMVKKIPPDKLIVFGESLGGAVAVDLAFRKQVGGLVIESTFTSLRNIAAITYPFIPTTLVSDSFDSLSKISNINCPILIVHGEKDELIPFNMAQTLFNAAKSSRAFFPVKDAGHNDVYWVGGAKYIDRLQKFIDEE